MQKIKKTINKDYFIENFSDYFNNLIMYEDGDLDNIDILDNDKNKIKKVLVKLYPVLNYTASGVMYDILDIIIDSIINPLILDTTPFQINRCFKK